MHIEHQLVSIFCQMDDFSKQLDNQVKRTLLLGSASRGPNCGLTNSEIATILVMAHYVRFRDFKTFYCDFLKKYWKHYFPKLPTYQRFIELMKRAILPLILFISARRGNENDIYYIDSSCLPVCHIKRSRRHKTFEGIAEYGKTSVGWFFGLKLHLVVNDKGQIMAFKITSGSKHDSQCSEDLLSNLQGLAFGDKGYIGKKQYENLLKNGLKLITRKRKNMKKQNILSDYEQQLLNQRNMIETILGHLKHHYEMWHTRHRSICNAMTHMTAALAAYVIEPLKLSAIKLLTMDMNPNSLSVVRG